MPESTATSPQTLAAFDPFAVQRAVLHVAQPVEGGVAAYVNAVSVFQAERGWDVHVASPDGCEVPGVAGHEWSARRHPLAGVSGEVRRLSAIIERVRPDIVVLHSAKAGLVGRLAIRGRIPTVYVPHAWSFLALPSPLSANALAWERAASRWTSAVVAVSAGEARLGVEAGITAPMVVVPNPVPDGFVGASRAIPRRARRRLSLPDRPTVVTVGRLSRQKGQDLLLAAWPDIRSSVDAQLVFVGEGPAKADLAGTSDDSVIFAGAHSDVRPWLQAADVVAIPSRWEGMALSMLEALASGRSVVTHHVAGSDIVVQARAGASVAVGDRERFAAAVVTRLKRRELARREGARGARFVSANHRAEDTFTAMSATCLRAGVFGRPAAKEYESPR